jgi:hypothetical protein
MARFDDELNAVHQAVFRGEMNRSNNCQSLFEVSAGWSRTSGINDRRYRLPRTVASWVSINL